MSHAARVEGALLHPAAPLMASIYSYGYIDADSFFATKESVKTQFAACFKIYKVIGTSFQILRNVYDRCTLFLYMSAQFY